MQMSKNRPRVNARDGKSVRWNFFRPNKLKTVILASLEAGLAGQVALVALVALVVRNPALDIPAGGGPDWTRTSDPALIKRML